MDYYVLSQIVNGVIFGLIYALIALGLTVVFSIMRVVNFSHGEFYMLGGYTLYDADRGRGGAVLDPALLADHRRPAAGHGRRRALRRRGGAGACCARSIPRAWTGRRSTPSS